MAISVNGIICPSFFEENEGTVEMLNKDGYFNLLRRKLVEALRRKCINVDPIWFLQDEAPCDRMITGNVWPELLELTMNRRDTHLI